MNHKKVRFVLNKKPFIRHTVTLTSRQINFFANKHISNGGKRRHTAKAKSSIKLRCQMDCEISKFNTWGKCILFVDRNIKSKSDLNCKYAMSRQIIRTNNNLMFLLRGENWFCKTIHAKIPWVFSFVTSSTRRISILSTDIQFWDFFVILFWKQTFMFRSV